MTDAERKQLLDKRQQLENDKAAAIAKANQATGAIAMIDVVLAFHVEEQPEPAKANGHAHEQPAPFNA